MAGRCDCCSGDNRQYCKYCSCSRSSKKLLLPKYSTVRSGCSCSVRNCNNDPRPGRAIAGKRRARSCTLMEPRARKGGTGSKVPSSLGSCRAPWRATNCDLAIVVMHAMPSARSGRARDTKFERGGKGATGASESKERRRRGNAPTAAKKAGKCVRVRRRRS